MCVSIDSKWSKTHKNAKKDLPLWRALRLAQRAAKRNLTYPCGRFVPSGFALALLGRFAPSGFALRARYLSHVTPRVPRSVHAKFHADWTKTVGARGIHTDTHTHTDRQSFFYYIDVHYEQFNIFCWTLTFPGAQWRWRIYFYCVFQDPRSTVYIGPLNRDCWITQSVTAPLDFVCKVYNIKPILDNVVKILNRI